MNTNSGADTHSPAKRSSKRIVLIVRHPVPSLNALFAMTHWERLREKKRTQAAFVSGSLVSDDGSLIPIISVQSGTLTVCVIPGSSRMIGFKTSSLKSASKRLKARATNAPALKLNLLK